MEFTQSERSGFLSKHGRSLLWVSLLLLPMLFAIWFGLNIVRVKTYDYAADYALHYGDFRQSLFYWVVRAQDGIFWTTWIDVAFSLLLGITLGIRKLLKFQLRHDDRRDVLKGEEWLQPGQQVLRRCLRMTISWGGGAALMGVADLYSWVSPCKQVWTEFPFGDERRLVCKITGSLTPCVEAV